MRPLSGSALRHATVLAKSADLAWRAYARCSALDVVHAEALGYNSMFNSNCITTMTESESAKGKR